MLQILTNTEHITKDNYWDSQSGNNNTSTPIHQTKCVLDVKVKYFSIDSTYYCISFIYKFWRHIDNIINE